MGQFSLFGGDQEEAQAPEPEVVPAPAALESAGPPPPQYWTDVRLDWHMGRIYAVVRTNRPGEKSEQYRDFPTKVQALEAYGVSRQEGDHMITVWFGDRKLTEEAP